MACLLDVGNGTCRLILDDVTSDSLTNPIRWFFEGFYSCHDYGDADLDRMNLSDREYQIIGQSLVAPYWH